MGSRLSDMNVAKNDLKGETNHVWEAFFLVHTLQITRAF